MTRLHRLALAILATTFVMAAAPSFAAVRGDCLWTALPAPVRDGLIDGYRTKGFEALSNVEITDDTTLALRKGCNLQPEDDYTAGEVIGAMVLEQGADVVLFERNGVARGTMDRTWRALSTADRDALTLFGLNIMKGDNGGAEDAGRVVFAVMARLGLPTDKLNNDVFGYLLGRAIREAREAGRT